MTVEITAETLKNQQTYFDRAPLAFTAAARMALNDVARGKGMKILRQAIIDQVAFPAGYVNNDRLRVSQPATNANLEVRITARMRPTSLARFAPGQTPASTRGKGVRVQVQAGTGEKLMKSAFLVRLKAGASLTADNFNLGLAIRLKPGERVINKRQQNQVQLSHNVYLLYGPSIDQVFREVAPEQAPAIGEQIETEFFRQFVRLTDDGGYA